MDIPVTDLGACPEEIPILATRGRIEVMEVVRMTIEALGAGYFYGRVQQIHSLFTDSPEFFIDQFEEMGIEIYSFRPGVADLLDRIFAGATKIGGGIEVHVACDALAALAGQGNASTIMN